MSQEYRKTILIVCEGQRSEPDYFHNLRNEVISKISDVYIKILPIPKDEQEEIEKEASSFKLRRGGKKREVRKAINKIEPKEYIIEEDYRAQPTCYIRKAQLAYFEKDYSELWAIYDKDGHPDHEKAYLLSIDNNICNKIVNIGFSAVSFEEWILMHFEFCDIPFLKSQCRDSDKNVFDCGTHTNELDCSGEKCVVGRIVEQKHLDYNASKNFGYNDFSNLSGTAYKNAIKSRDLAEDKVNFYNNNPFVSVDRLVFKLKNIEKGDLNWVYQNVFEIESNVILRVQNQFNTAEFIIENQSEKTFIVLENFVELIDVDFNVLWSNNRKILNSGDNVKIYSKENLSIEDFQYATFRINENEYCILDVVQIKNFT